MGSREAHVASEAVSRRRSIFFLNNFFLASEAVSRGRSIFFRNNFSYAHVANEAVPRRRISLF